MPPVFCIAVIRLSVTRPASLIVLASVALEARCRIDLAVDHMLTYIVSRMGHGPLGGFLILVARFQFFFVGMAVEAESLSVACVADLALLRSREPVAHGKSLRMIHGSPPVSVAIAADRGSFHFDRMTFGHACGFRACVQDGCETGGEECKNNQFYKRFFLHLFPPLAADNRVEVIHYFKEPAKILVEAGIFHIFEIECDPEILRHLVASCQHK